MSTSTDEMWKRDEAHIREAMARQSASAQAPVEDRGASKLVGSGSLVRTAVSSAGVLEIARLLEMQARDKDQTPADAGLLMYCTEVLRQHAAAMTERQPEENKADMPTCGK